MSPRSKLLGSKHGWIRSLGVSLLSRKGKPADVELLAEAIKDEHAGVRRRAARVLGRSATGRRVVDCLRTGLADTDLRVRMESIAGLQRQRCSHSLLIALSHDDSNVRRGAALALGKIEDSDTTIVDALLGGVSDPDPEVAKAALASLCRIGDITACDPLLRLRQTLLSEPLVRALERTVMRLRGWPQLNDQMRVLLWNRLVEDRRLLTFSVDPTRGNAEKYCKRRLAELTSGRGSGEAPGERTALEIALEDLTVSGADLVALQEEYAWLQKRITQGQDLTAREHARHATAKALLALANGTGQYDPATVTQAMLPVLCCVAR